MNNKIVEESVKSVLLLRSADLKTTLTALATLREKFPQAELNVLVQSAAATVLQDQNLSEVNLIFFPYRDFNLAVPENLFADLPEYDLALSLYKNDGNGYEEVDAFLLSNIQAKNYGGISGEMNITYRAYSVAEKKKKYQKNISRLFGNSEQAELRSKDFSEKYCPENSKMILAGEAEIVVDEGGTFNMSENTICRFGFVPPDWQHIRDEGKAVARIQKDAVMNINGSCNFFNGVKINLFQGAEFSIGEGSYIAFDSHFFIEKSIVIGKNCAISWNVEMIDTDFHRVNLSDDEIGRSGIIIGDSVWIGNGVKILKGVELADNVLVAAHAVVTKSFHENAIIAGNPAKQIGTKEGNYRV